MNNELRIKGEKPLGIRAYGSIGHLPNSRLGPGDHKMTKAQARICTVKERDDRDMIFVQEKLDGACTAVAKINGKIIALGRAGYPAISSKYVQHHMFHYWVLEHQKRFQAVLKDGERIVGEWLAQAHGTKYDLTGREPFVAFDIMVEHTRFPYSMFRKRVNDIFQIPALVYHGGTVSTEEAMEFHQEGEHLPCDQVEGLIYRVERDGEVDFLAKYVRPDKVDGKYLPEVSGKPAVWNWPVISPFSNRQA